MVDHLRCGRSRKPSLIIYPPPKIILILANLKIILTLWVYIVDNSHYIDRSPSQIKIPKLHFSLNMQDTRTQNSVP